MHFPKSTYDQPETGHLTLEIESAARLRAAAARVTAAGRHR